VSAVPALAVFAFASLRVLRASALGISGGAEICIQLQKRINAETRRAQRDAENWRIIRPGADRIAGNAEEALRGMVVYGDFR